MNWFSEVVLILSVTSIIHKIIDKISFGKSNKNNKVLGI